MAKVGMEYVCSAELEENKETGEVTYKNHKYWGRSSAFNISPNANDVDDWGDDGIAESDKSLISLGISVELNENTLEVESSILGHEYDEETGEMTVSANDIAPYVGLGFVGKSLRNNKRIFRGVFFRKVQFSTPGDDNQTKTESTTFNHSTYEGKAYPIGEDLKIQDKKEFDTLAEAKAWLDKKLGKTA